MKMKSWKSLLGLLLAIAMAFSALPGLGITAAAADDLWGYDGRSTPHTSFLLTNRQTSQEIGTFCMDLATYGLSRDSYYALYDSQEIQSLLELSPDAMAEIRYAVAMMRTMYAGSAFSLENAKNRFPEETLSRPMGASLTQELVWYREHLETPSRYPLSANMKNRPFTASEQAFFYGKNNEPLNIGDRYDIEISGPTSAMADENRLVGPFKVDYTPDSSESLVNINGPVRFSLSPNDPAYLVVMDGGTPQVVREVSLGQEFYLRPRAVGTNEVTLIPKSTIITEVVAEYIFFNDGFQGQYGLEFDIWDGELKAAIEFETEPGEELPPPDITKEVKETGTSDDNYGKEISVPENSTGLFRITIDTFDDGGIDLIFSPKTDEERLAANVVEIYTPEQFWAVRNKLSGSYKLMNNIDMTNYIKMRTVFGSFEPIGSAASPFTGTFDGGGYTISGVTIDSVSNNVGLFGYIGNTAEVKNLVVANSDIAGTNNVGAVIGYSDGGRFSNLHAEHVAISAANNAGGLVGFSGSTAQVSNCSGLDITIKSNAGGQFSRVGGLFGTVCGSLNNCLIDGLTVNVTDASTLAVPFGHGGIAGVVGNGSASVTVTNCIANDISFIHSSAVGDTFFITGGIVGYGAASSAGQTTVEYCSVSGMNFSGYGTLGGILGLSQYMHVLNNCVVNDATINSKRGVYMTSSPFYDVDIGGITSGYYRTATIVESCAVNNITINAEMICGSNYAASLIGGISGRVGSTGNNASSFKNCYTSGTINVFTTQYWVSGTGSPRVSGIVASGSGVENCISEISIYDTTSFAGDAALTINGIGGGAKNSVAANPNLSLPAMMLKPVTPPIDYVQDPRDPENKNTLKRVGGSNNNIALAEMVLNPSPGTPIYVGKVSRSDPNPPPNAIYTLADTLTGADGLSVSRADLYRPETYTTAYGLGFDLTDVWLPPSEDTLPRLRNLGPQDPGAVGSGLSAASDDEVWAKGARTYYVVDTYDGRVISPSELLDSDGATPMKTDENGTAVITIAPHGSYTFYYQTETLVQGEYVNSVSIGLIEDNAKITVTEPKEEGFFVSVTKYATSILTELPDGWEFSLYRDGETDPVGTLTNASQTIELSVPGQYVLKETVKPDGYKLDATEYRFEFTGKQIIPDPNAAYENGYFSISIVDDDTLLTLSAINIREDIDDPNKTTGIRVIKRDSETNQIIADDNMVFKLYDDSQTEVAELNASNNFTADGLEDGRYTLTEHVPPDGYVLPDDGSVTFVIEESMVLIPVAVPNDMYEFDPLPDADNIFSVTAFNESDGEEEDELFSLTVSKTVAGGGSTSKYFYFTVAFDGEPLNGIVSNNPEFTTADEGSTFRGRLRHNESVVFTNIPAGVNYTVTEDSAADYTALPSRIQTGMLEKNETVNYINRYDGGPSPTPTRLTLTGTKTATGATLVDGQFNFAVYENGSRVATGTNTAAGVIRFSEITYTAAGTHTYTVRETSISNGKWTVDSTVFTVTVTVVENSDGTLTATAAYPKNGLTFHNTYTDTTEPEPETVTLSIRKSLVDYNGDKVGTGKKFAVRLYDDQMNLIGRYILSANEGSVAVSGLKSGTVYYLQEEKGDGFECRNFEIVGVGTVENSAIGIKIPTYGNELLIEIVVKNEAYNLEEIPDEEPPLSPYDPPSDPGIIEIPEETPPLGSPQTGDAGLLACLFVLPGLSLVGMGITLRIGKRGKYKR